VLSHHKDPSETVSLDPDGVDFFLIIKLLAERVLVFETITFVWLLPSKVSKLNLKVVFVPAVLPTTTRDAFASGALQAE